MVINFISKFFGGLVTVFKLLLDSVEEAVAYVFDKIKKVITIRDITFLLIGSAVSSFICSKIYEWYADHAVKTGYLIIKNIVYKLVTTGGN